MITLDVHISSLQKVEADLVAVVLFEDEDLLSLHCKSLNREIPGIADHITVADFRGKGSESILFFPAGIATKRLLLIGAGKQNEFTRERARRVAAIAAKNARTQKAKTVAIIEPQLAPSKDPGNDFGEKPLEALGLALGEGAVLSQYSFSKYITTEKKHLVRKFVVIAGDAESAKSIKRGLQLAAVICAGTIFARDLENAPGNEIFPESLAQQARSAGRQSGFTVSVFDERKIKRLGMGGLLGVAMGSHKPPRFIIMEYKGRKTGKPVVLVGKGITFDSGGISIKPSANMAEMKMDMSGAAAVIATLQVVSTLKLPLHVIGLVPAAENLPGGLALKPGDILTHLNGKTSEVDNTDAEGRLILADALAYAGRFSPSLVIDLATLTGACVVALGHVASGMMGNNQEEMNELAESGLRTYERVWQLPMFDEYEKLIKSDIADVKNVGGRWAGAITAAMFLRKFIGEYSWIHLDIAGTSIMEEAQDYIPKGGSGVGVRLLVDFLRHRV
jgi:leucyl aminopeptidase